MHFILVTRITYHSIILMMAEACRKYVFKNSCPFFQYLSLLLLLRSYENVFYNHFILNKVTFLFITISPDIVTFLNIVRQKTKLLNKLLLLKSVYYKK